MRRIFRLMDTRDPGLHRGAAALLMQLAGAPARQARSRGALGALGAPTDRLEVAPRRATSTLPAAAAVLPRPHALARPVQLVGGWRGRGVQGDERAPQLAAVVALALIAEQPGDLEVVQPALDALAVRTDPALSLDARRRRRPPVHDRCQRGDELRDRAREAPRALRARPAPQQALDR